MRVLFVSGELIGSAICHELLREKHDLKLYIERDGWKRCLDGIIPKTDDWEGELDWVGKDGLIVFDDVGFGEEQDRLREKGYRVVGGSMVADRLELDREHFHTVLRALGIKTLPSHDFDDIQEAIDFIKDNPDRWVVKQNSHLGVLNYVGECPDGTDAIAALENYTNLGIPSAHLQKRVNGIEVGVGRYFNGNDWVGPIEINHEHKRMCNDDVGPLTPEMGTVIWFSDDNKLPLFRETLAKLKPFLQKSGFKGEFDINCIINGQDIWPLEATARFGTPATELKSMMMSSSWIDLLISLADGTAYHPTFSDEFGVTVSIAVPPYPYMKESIATNQSPNELLRLMYKSTITEEDLKHIYYEEISKMHNGDGKEILYWAGSNGWVMHVTAHAVTVEEARKKVYGIIDKIILPKKFYRTDIGVRVASKDLPHLREWGWI
jgi:phosphoribosylamine--glycine ligase